MKTVVIFGGSGFVGQNIVRQLAKKGYRIVIPYQQPTNEAKLRLFGDVGQIIPIKFINLREKLIKSIIYESDILINLKTIWQETKLYSYKKNILDFNIQLVDLINFNDKNKPFLFFSGLGVNENSLSIRSRYIAKTESYILQKLTNSLIIRPSIIIGVGDHFISKLLTIFKFSFFIPLFGGGNVKLQPVYIDDVAQATVRLIESEIKIKKIFELVGPEIFTYKNLYQFVANCLKIRRVFFSIPFSLARIVASLIEKTPFNLITLDQLLLFKEDNITSNKFDNFSDLDIQPQDTKEILKKILQK